jgi:hypothetical protein
MFQAISHREFSQLEALGELFERTNPAAALLCLDYCFTNPPRIQALHVDGVASKLQAFHTYVKLLNNLTWTDPCTVPAVEKLFRYVRQGENDFWVPDGTFLHSTLRRLDHPACYRAIDENIVLSGSELRDVFQRTLIDRLRRRVQDENDVCKRNRAFSPCLVFSVFDGHCNRVDCPDEHIPAALMNTQQYNLRVRIHLQQILIFQTVQFIINDPIPRR